MKTINTLKMKRIFCFNALLIFGTILFAQAPVGQPSYKEWYVPFCMVASESFPKGESVHGVNFKRNEWPCLFNLTNKEGKGKFTFYFEDGSTLEKDFMLAPGRVNVSAFHRPEYLKLLSGHTAFGVKIVSDVEIIPQFSSTEDGEKFGGDLFRSVGLSRMAHPGPLSERETKWVLPDGHLKLYKDNADDRDWFIFLNPGSETVKLSLKMVYKEKTLYKELSVDPHCIRVYEPGSDPEITAEFLNQTTYSLVVDSSEPIVMEAIRRYLHREEQTPLNSWELIPFAIGDVVVPDPAF